MTSQFFCMFSSLLADLMRSSYSPPFDRGLFSTFALLFLVATSLWMRSNVDLTETIFAWAVQQCGLFLLHNTMAMFCWRTLSFYSISAVFRN